MIVNTEDTEGHTGELRLGLIVESFIIGGIGGLIVLLYRILLDNSWNWLNMILDYAKGSPFCMAGWFAVLFIVAWVVSKLISYEPMISGGGIPQAEGEIAGKLEQTWWKVLPARFAAGFLCLLCGLALGKAGPSIHLGAMAGKGVSKSLGREKSEEKLLVTCGVSAGLSAVFQTPLSGVMFCLEEIHKGFSTAVFVTATVSALTASYIVSAIIGGKAIFRFDILKMLPQKHYWMIIILGIVLGIFGALYNWSMLKAQELYNKAGFPSTTVKLMVPFFCAGILGFTAPELLGSGNVLLVSLTTEHLMLGTILLILAGRFVFCAVTFGSGAPGGFFFPLLVLSGLVGGAFAAAGIQYWGLDPMYANNFVLLAMAGGFAAIMRAPLTGIILIFEMTGSFSQLMSLAVVSLTAYIVAELLKSRPICESLLEGILKKRNSAAV